MLILSQLRHTRFYDEGGRFVDTCSRWESSTMRNRAPLEHDAAGRDARTENEIEHSHDKRFSQSVWRCGLTRTDGALATNGQGC